jgi:dTMP kinase
MSEGKLIVIDGIDGSGKGTQVNLLMDKLKSEGYDVFKADFPRYNEYSSIFVTKYLNGLFGTSDQVSAKKASTFYAIDRFAASFEMKEHLEKGGIIISNRYVSANKIHQASKIEDEDELDEFLNWVDDLEYNIYGIPKPDKVLFLNVPPKIGQSLVDKKTLRKYLDGKKRDIHEEDIDHLKKAYLRACGLVDRYDNWEEILCIKNDELRTIDDIQEEIYNKVKKIIGEK